MESLAQYLATNPAANHAIEALKRAADDRLDPPHSLESVVCGLLAVAMEVRELTAAVERSGTILSEVGDDLVDAMPSEEQQLAILEGLGDIATQIRQHLVWQTRP